MQVKISDSEALGVMFSRLAELYGWEEKAYHAWKLYIGIQRYDLIENVNGLMSYFYFGTDNISRMHKHDLTKKQIVEAIIHPAAFYERYKLKS